jgi:hypothetical protein
MLNRIEFFVEFRVGVFFPLGSYFFLILDEKCESDKTTRKWLMLYILHDQPMCRLMLTMAAKTHSPSDIVKTFLNFNFESFFFLHFLCFSLLFYSTRTSFVDNLKLKCRKVIFKIKFFFLIA